jgi:hypothetical protein
MICAEIQQEEITVRTDALTPWERSPHSLVNWWDMEQFHLENIYTIIHILEQIRRNFAEARGAGDPMFAPKDFRLSEQQRLEVAGGIPGAIGNLSQIGLKATADALRELHMELNATRQMQFMKSQLVTRIEDVQRSMRREMASHLFLYIPRDQAERYQKPREGWEEVVSRFPSAIIDIEECSLCFACDRWAGAVFHAVSITEHGIIEFGKLLQLNDPKPGWQSVSREVDKILNRTKYADLSALHKQHFKLIEQVSPLMLAMNDAWRNKIGHVANRLILMSGEFDDRVADDIVRTTRSFMRRLATDLPKTI